MSRFTCQNRRFITQRRNDRHEIQIPGKLLAINNPAGYTLGGLSDFTQRSSHS
jgi:hypothetical protein